MLLYLLLNVMVKILSDDLYLLGILSKLKPIIYYRFQHRVLEVFLSFFFFLCQLLISFRGV